MIVKTLKTHWPGKHDGEFKRILFRVTIQRVSEFELNETRNVKCDTWTTKYNFIRSLLKQNPELTLLHQFFAKIYII